MPQTFGGNEGQPEFASCIRTQVRHGLGAETDRLALVAVQALFAAEQGQQFILTIAGHAGDADDFAAAHVKVDVFQRAAERVRVVPGQAAHLQKSSPPITFG